MRYSGTMQYDLIVIGGSAAGASASIYAARRGLNLLVVAKDLGGEVATSGDVENWLGIEHTTGSELASQFAAHLRKYAPNIAEGYIVTKLEQLDSATWQVTLDDGATHTAPAVIVATGVHSRELGVPGEKEFRLRGVSYCTVCDGPLFGGKKCVTIGGGNSALESALMLADIASHVTVVNKNSQFKGEQVLMDNLKSKKNVDIIYDAKTTDFFGTDGFAKGLHYQDKEGVSHELAFDGAFVHIGNVPNSGFVPENVKRSAFGEIEVDLACATSAPGVFAAGDVTNIPHKQIIISAGMGSCAALSAVQYINRLSL